MRKLYYKLCDYLEYRREKRFYKNLRDGMHGVMQIKLDYEHLGPTTSSVHCGYPFDHRSVQYHMPDEKQLFEKIGHNFW